MKSAIGRTLIIVAVALGAGLLWWRLTRPDSTPYRLSEPTLSKWTLVTSDGTDPWIVGIRPPDTLLGSLFAEVSRRSGTSLVAPPHPALPLVLRTEFEEGLQGVYGVDSVLRIAREAGLEESTFQPVCLAHRTDRGPSGSADVYFVPFESVAFNRMRADLVPAQPEQAGIGVYEPTTLSPVLIVGATDSAFERWWPLRFDRARDCEASLGASPTGN